ncbi:MAG TPA: hypothetical protein VK783_05145 [Bacteroidia bacterium]|jgi:hypothetical protein|nr:hypothetical protein [Bacteroidia bacterium]
MMKIYLSRKFYEGECLSALEPEVELAALDNLKVRLLRREEYEAVQLVQNRINLVIEGMENARHQALAISKLPDGSNATHLPFY